MSISILLQVKNGYKLKEETGSGTKMPPQRERDARPRQLQPVTHTTPTINFGETIEEAAIAAAYKIAEAENKAFVAAEAVKEAERVSKMAEDADSMLLLAREILDRCKSLSSHVGSLSCVLICLFQSYLMMLQARGTNSCLWREGLVLLVGKKWGRLDSVYICFSSFQLFSTVGYLAVRFALLQVLLYFAARCALDCGNILTSSVRLESLLLR